MNTSHSIHQHSPGRGMKFGIAGIACLALFFTLGWSACAVTSRSWENQTDAPVVYFSPRGGARQAIVDSIDTAEHEILLALYYFTDPGLADALIQARQRGVVISVILDKSQRHGRHSQAERLQEAGIPVTFDTRHRIFHHKFMVIDGATVVTGSQNWTRSAETVNAENTLTFAAQAGLAKHFQNEFWRLNTQEGDVPANKRKK